MRTATPLDHFRVPSRPTPFHPRLAALSETAAWMDWSGWISPRHLRDAEVEYFAIRNSAAVFDATPLRKYRIAGPDAEAVLDRLTVRDVSRLRPGRVQYTAWCDDDGKVLDDGTLFRFSAEDFRLCSMERHLDWLLAAADGFRVAVADETEEVATLALQGPTSWSVLKAAGAEGVETLRPHDVGGFVVPRVGPVVISRTGFTGDLGYELWCAPDLALALWDRLFEAGAPFGITAVGHEAVDLARIEAGFILSGTDFVPAGSAVRLDRRRSPFELGLGWMVDFGKTGHFNGRRALAAEKARGGGRHVLVGLDIDGNVPADHALVFHGTRREVGQSTSSAWSPSAKRSIALASLLRPYGEEKSSNLHVEIFALRELVHSKSLVRARVVKRPFYAPARRWLTPPEPF